MSTLDNWLAITTHYFEIPEGYEIANPLSEKVEQLEKKLRKITNDAAYYRRVLRGIFGARFKGAAKKAFDKHYIRMTDNDINKLVDEVEAVFPKIEGIGDYEPQD